MTPDDRKNEFVIAALGASAGGLEPLETFFKAMPPEAGIAFVVIQHLAPNHATALPQLLGRHTRLPVEEARDNMPVAPNRVYVIPPNATLTIKDCTLHVTEPAEARGARAPIDRFFSSLADDRGENAVCIMLSGTGTDGTLGLRAIKEHGGMAMAQTLESAKYDAILRSAISTGLVDHVLPVEEMPAKLIEYAADLPALNDEPNHIREQIAANMAKIHSLLRQRKGHDFSDYKESTIVRRVERRLKVSQTDTVEKYIELLERQHEEADQLFNDLLIGVTQFFRDADAFEALERDVIPKILAGKSGDSQVRACCIGCATGEEAYSIAILLSECASMMSNAPQIQVFATDIDGGAIDTARKGRYPESIEEQVRPDRLERYFVKQGSAYVVKQELRELCIFSAHSLIKDAPFSRLDLIVCRNVMIYLGQDLQRKVMPIFHYALRPGGYLFLGPSESANTHRELFEALDKTHRIYQRKETIARPVVTLPLGDAIRPASGARTRQEPKEPDLSKQLERIILQRYRPACVTVHENGDAIYFSGSTSRYLEQPTGRPDSNVINMAREGLRIPLRTALQRATAAHERVTQKQISIQHDGSVSYADLTVEPIDEFRAAHLYMIVFEDAVLNGGPSSDAAAPIDSTAEATIRHLEEELRAAREYAQATFEELESSSEELKSANEEYQSTNEELESSKEELQSYNEELQTVNAEIGRKVAELYQTNGDLQNLLNSTKIATIFLDLQLRIRNFTPAAGAVFRLITSDVGRPITDLAAQFAGVDLVSDIRDVLQTLKRRERQLVGADGRHFQLRVLPYTTVDNVVNGVVLVFTDVTQLNDASQRLEDAKTYAENIIATVRDPLLVLDSEARVRSANPAFYKMFRVSEPQTLNVVLYELGSGQWNIAELRRLIGEILPNQGTVENFEVSHDFPGIGVRSMQLNARRIETHSATEPLVLLTIEDVTERKEAERIRMETQSRAERAMRDKEVELARIARTLMIGEMATFMAHEINQPLAGVVTNAEAGLRWLSGKPAKVQEAIHSLSLIVRDGNRASAVIRQIRGFVENEVTEPAALDIHEVIREALGLVKFELEKNQVEVSFDLVGGLPLVRGNRAQLEQVVLNIAINACDAMSSVTDRPRQMLVRAKLSTDDEILVSIRDSGVGMDEQDIERMYDAFYTTKPTGVGMGLSICRSIIQAHGGRIWATRNKWPGLTVQFTLPVIKESSS